MRGLLLKDWLVVSRQTKVYFVLMIGFALMPQMGTYSIFFGALLPITAFAYDERSRWDTMARMMPYSFWNIVTEKYVFGYLAVGGIVLLEMMVQIVYCLMGVSPLGIGVSMQGIWIPVLVALILMALEMPVIFWIGVEKTRMFLMFATIFATLALQSHLAVAVIAIPEFELPMGLAVLGAAVILQIFSMSVSKKLYRSNPQRKR